MYIKIYIHTQNALALAQTNHVTLAHTDAPFPLKFLIFVSKIKFAFQSSFFLSYDFSWNANYTNNRVLHMQFTTVVATCSLF